jgi:hypothetical protein
MNYKKALLVLAAIACWTSVGSSEARAEVGVSLHFGSPYYHDPYYYRPYYGYYPYYTRRPYYYRHYHRHRWHGHRHGHRPWRGRRD